MEEKLRFIVEHRSGDLSMTALCARYGISRETGYELVRRFAAFGLAGLEPRSRAPHRPGLKMADEIAAAILAARRERPHWGPKKLRVVLERQNSSIAWPAASTIGDLLRREGLSAPRRRRRRAVPQTQPFAPVEAANDLWCVDYKGWFRTRDGVRCDPLTLSDAHSRFVLESRIAPQTIEAAKPVIDEAFRRFGLPRAIRSDNGSPFASTGAGGLTRLSVHWVKLGIGLERIAPGEPQQNGRHERMHGTMQQEVGGSPAPDAAALQARLDAFRADFNEVRPHEALGQQTPASCYAPSPRRFPDTIEEPWYDAEHAVRRVRHDGCIKWGGEPIFVSEAVAGEPVGIAETDSGNWIVRFAGIELGYIDRRTKKLHRFAPARPGRRKASEQTEETVNHVPGP